MGVKIGWANQHVATGGTLLIDANDPNQPQKQKDLLERRVNTRVKQALSEALTFTEDQRDGLSPTSVARDLSEHQQCKVYEQTYYLYKTNPIARAIIEIQTDFVVGEGFTFQATGKLQDEFEKFWNNPNNNWEIRQENKVRELALYGNQFYTVAINEFTGRTEMGYIDPARVKTVTFLNGNTEIVDKIVLYSDKIGGDVTTKDAVREDPKTGKLVGEVFYFSVNRVSNAKFGTSDLLASLEWADIYDQFLFNAAERTLLQDAYVWDYTWDGLDEGQVKQKARAYRSAPKPGSSRHHNEKVKVQAIGPNHNGNQNTKIMADLIKHYTIMGERIPEHWLSVGGETNFATAKSMGTPIFKMLRRRQKLWVAQLDLIFRYVAENLLSRKMVSQEEVDAGWMIEPSEISVEDHAEKATSLDTIGRSLALAEVQGWLTKEQASMAYETTARRLNIQIIPEEQLPKGATKADPDRDMSQQKDTQTTESSAIRAYEDYRKELEAA